jgi:hypothetical protein
LEKPNMTLTPGTAQLALLIVGTSFASAQQYVITTYAGGAPPPTPVLGINASITQPFGIASDAASNVYLTSDSCVFKLDHNGVLNRVAGNARTGYSGDGGPAINAQISSSQVGLAVDGLGNLYIADLYNNRVRKVSPAGVITTITGNGTNAYSGDGGPAASAAIGVPYGVATDTVGNLYIADFYSQRVRRISPSGVITTIAGNGIGGYAGDGGPAVNAEINSPYGLAVDGAGNLYIGDFGKRPCPKSIARWDHYNDRGKRRPRILGRWGASHQRAAHWARPV